jgi:hypothetical protein
MSAFEISSPHARRRAMSAPFWDRSLPMSPYERVNARSWPVCDVRDVPSLSYFHRDWRWLLFAARSDRSRIAPLRTSLFPRRHGIRILPRSRRLTPDPSWLTLSGGPALGRTSASLQCPFCSPSGLARCLPADALLAMLCFAQGHVVLHQRADALRQLSALIGQHSFRHAVLRDPGEHRQKERPGKRRRSR